MRERDGREGRRKEGRKKKKGRSMEEIGRERDKARGQRGELVELV
jgi:hypothetical protein